MVPSSKAASPRECTARDQKIAIPKDQGILNRNQAELGVHQKVTHME